MKEEDFLQRKAGWTQEVTAKLQLRLKSKKNATVLKDAHI